MKNIVLGLIGIFITMYTMLIGLNLLSFYTQKNELEKHVSRVVKNTLEAEYQNDDVVEVEQMLLQELKEAILAETAQIEVEIKAMDLQKGILSVRVTKRVVMLNGKKREIVVEKTAIVERMYLGDIDTGFDICDGGSRDFPGKCI